MPVAAAALGDHGVEIGRSLAQRDPPLAVRRAAVGLALDAAIDHHHVAARPLHLERFFHQHRAGTIERNDIGHPVTLAGDDHQAAGLHRGIRDQRVADHDGRDLLRQPHQLGLIENHGHVGGGSRPRRHRQASAKPQASTSAKNALDARTPTPSNSPAPYASVGNTGGRRMGRSTARVDAKMVNEMQMRVIAAALPSTA